MVEREGSNSFSGKQLEAYLKTIDKADDRLIKLKVEHMEACKGPRSNSGCGAEHGP
jgi:hypothetical protein